ncbi:MAG TPA: DUF1648 domain-containing protein [Burkholderiales bacterium]|nr:DUF1648 domain-containing protein [Burkholderiales bacterium]
MEIPRRILWLLAAAALLQIAWHYPQLPAKVASHFDGQGRPNGWMSRDGFFLLYGAMLALQLAIFGTGFRILRRLPDRMFNLPHRDYWLAPERRNETLDYLETWGLWFGCAVLALLLGIFQLAIDANLKQAPLPLGPTWALLGGFVAFTAIAVARLLLRFAQRLK